MADSVTLDLHATHALSCVCFKSHLEIFLTGLQGLRRRHVTAAISEAEDFPNIEVPHARQPVCIHPALAVTPHSCLQAWESEGFRPACDLSATRWARGTASRSLAGLGCPHIAWDGFHPIKCIVGHVLIIVRETECSCDSITRTRVRFIRERMLRLI
jgi:hypothetical protein